MITMSAPDQKEITALIKLLDDPDDTIYTHVKDRLISFGQEIIPTLESAWEFQDFGPLFQERVENIVHSIQFDSISYQLQNWAATGGLDLLKAMIIIAKYRYPDLDENHVHEQIDKLENDVWLELNNQLTALEKVRIINHILFDTHGFRGNKKEYHSPNNSYINEVLDSKKGNPITLSILYSIIAQRHQIPLYGINLPRHFILAYLDIGPYQLKAPNQNPSVLFYVNPFSKGSVFSKKEIDDFLKQLKIEPQAYYYFPCSNIDIIQRVLNNLMYSYGLENQEQKVEEIKHLLGLIQNKNQDQE